MDEAQAYREIISRILALPPGDEATVRTAKIDICRKYGCTTFSLLGGMMMGIYSEPPKPDDADNPVRLVLSAGTPLPICTLSMRALRCVRVCAPTSNS